MSDMNPTEIFRRYQRNELDKAVAINYLKSFIEGNREAELRMWLVESLLIILCRDIETFTNF